MAARYRRKMLLENNYRPTYIMSSHVLAKPVFIGQSKSLRKENQLNPLIRFAREYTGGSIDDVYGAYFGSEYQDVMLGVYNNFQKHVMQLLDQIIENKDIDQIIEFAQFIVSYINEVITKLKITESDDKSMDILDRGKDLILSIIDNMSKTTDFGIVNTRIAYLKEVIVQMEKASLASQTTNFTYI